MRRIVLFRRKDGADLDAFTSALQGLSKLNADIPDIDMWWVAVAPNSTDSWDAALVADFPDAEAMEGFDNHPAHVKVATAISAVSDFAVFNTVD